jgi:hypothetical protein
MITLIPYNMSSYPIALGYVAGGKCVYEYWTGMVVELDDSSESCRIMREGVAYSIARFGAGLVRELRQIAWLEARGAI